jgi:hypothetical protein
MLIINIVMFKKTYHDQPWMSTFLDVQPYIFSHSSWIQSLGICLGVSLNIDKKNFKYD